MNHKHHAATACTQLPIKVVQVEYGGLVSICLYRQAALPLRLPLVRKLQRKDAFDLSSSSDEDDIREWYPAGVSPWYYNEEAGVLELMETHWMDDVSITAMDLHRAAVIIQR